MGRVLAPAVGADVAVVALDFIVGVEVLKVTGFAVPEGFGGRDESVFGAGAGVRAFGDMDGA